MMRSYRFLIIVIVAVSFFCAPAWAEKKPSQRFVDLVSSADLGVSYEQINKNLLFYDVDNYKKGLYVGDREGTNFFISQTVTDVTEHTKYHVSQVRYELDHAGFFVQTRFAGNNRQTIGIGLGRKKMPGINFTRTSYRGYCRIIGGCDIYYSFDPTEVKTLKLRYEYDFPGAWVYGGEWLLERIEYEQPISNYKLDVHALSLYGKAKWDQWGANAKVAYMMPRDGSYRNSLGNNMNIELGVNYKVRRHLTLDLAFGWFFNGVPLAGTDFTSAGQQMVIPYLTGDDAFESLFDNSFKYVVLSATLSLK